MTIEVVRAKDSRCSLARFFLEEVSNVIDEGCVTILGSIRREEEVLKKEAMFGGNSGQNMGALGTRIDDVTDFEFCLGTAYP